MNQKQLQYFEEKAKSLGKRLLIEEVSLPIKNTNIEICTSSFKESVDGKDYDAVAILRNVPVSRYTENKNGRIYSRTLWEKVLKEGSAEGTLCLFDHPDDSSDGSIKDIAGVWHNMKLGEDMVTMDLYLVEDKPMRILKSHGKLGTSSVGFGELSESDSKTVNPESFSLERMGDLVMNPSQGTFATYENLSESNQTQTNILTESTTNIKEDIQKNDDKKIEQEMRTETMDKFTESVLKHQVSAVIEKAEEKAQDPLKMKEAIKTLRNCKADLAVEATDLHVKLDEAISSMTSKLEEKLSESSKNLKDRETLLEDITSKYDVLEKAHNQLKEDYNTVKALVEKTGSADSKKLTEMVDKLSKDRSLMESDINIFKEEVALRDKDITRFITERKTMLEDIEIFKKTVSKLKEATNRCAIKTKKKSMKEDEEYSDIGSAGDADVIDMDDDFPSPDEDVLDVDLDSDELIDTESTIEDVDSLGLDELDADTMIEAEEDDEEEDEEELTEEEDEDSKEDEKEDAEEKEKKEESTKRKVSVKPAIFEHYKRAVKKNPSLKDINKEILTSKSLYEAAKKIEKYVESKKQKEELVTLKESGYKIPSKDNTYKFKR